MASEINDDALKHIAQVGPQVVWLNQPRPELLMLA